MRWLRRSGRWDCPGSSWTTRIGSSSPTAARPSWRCAPPLPLPPPRARERDRGLERDAITGASERPFAHPRERHLRVPLSSASATPSRWPVPARALRFLLPADLPSLPSPHPRAFAQTVSVTHPAGAMLLRAVRDLTDATGDGAVSATTMIAAGLRRAADALRRVARPPRGRARPRVARTLRPRVRRDEAPRDHRPRPRPRRRGGDARRRRGRVVGRGSLPRGGGERRRRRRLREPPRPRRRGSSRRSSPRSSPTRRGRAARSAEARSVPSTRSSRGWRGTLP